MIMVYLEMFMIRIRLGKQVHVNNKKVVNVDNKWRFKGNILR